MSRSSKKARTSTSSFSLKLRSKRHQSVANQDLGTRSLWFPILSATVYIHNGKTFIQVLINDNMVGHKLGEFSQPVIRGHAADKKKR